MNQRSCILGLSAVLCLAIGCAAPAEPPAGAARQAQIDNGTFGWLRYTFLFAESEVLFADILVIGDTDLGDYRANEEYWFVEQSNLGLLGDEDLAIDADHGVTDPPVLAGDQELIQPVNVTWSRFTSDPVSGGYLYDSDNHHLRIGVTSNEITRLTWYQTIPSANTPENIELGVEAHAGSGSVGIPPGDYGYYVDATIE